MKNGGKNKTVAFIFLFSVYIILFFKFLKKSLSPPSGTPIL